MKERVLGLLLAALIGCGLALALDQWVFFNPDPMVLAHASTQQKWAA